MHCALNFPNILSSNSFLFTYYSLLFILPLGQQSGCLQLQSACCTQFHSLVSHVANTVRKTVSYVLNINIVESSVIIVLAVK